MLVHHDDIELVAGDAWAIDGQLLDEDGTPLNLTSGVDLGWTLRGPDGRTVAGLIANGATLDKINPTGGGVVVNVPGTLTRDLPPGRYTDTIRVWTGGNPAQMWQGHILVACDQFASDITL